MFTNVFEPPPMDNIIYIPGRPHQYRADCKAGQFKIGESNMIGPKLEMEIIGFRTIEGELFNYPYQQWLEILFVRENVVSQVLFKTESMDNFINYFLVLGQKGSNVGLGVTTARMCKRSNDTGNYYAAEFEFKESDPKRIKELQLFASEHEIYSARLAPSNGNSVPTGTEATTENGKAKVTATISKEELDDSEVPY